jgi:hypothetical protein
VPCNLTLYGCAPAAVVALRQTANLACLLLSSKEVPVGLPGPLAEVAVPDDVCCEPPPPQSWLPHPAVGEDVALALELQCRGHASCYLHDRLAVGEVPTSIRAICMQKSRSAFSKEHAGSVLNPLHVDNRMPGSHPRTLHW